MIIFKENGGLEDIYTYQDFKILIEKFKIKRIIETGTYKGFSAKKLSEFNLPVDTIEINPDIFCIAKEYLANIDNVNVHLGSSPDILNQILKESEENIIFFLDAHWYEYWPLLDELNTIFHKKIKNSVIAIHDFYVPDENGNHKFGYDQYDNVILDFNYIEDSINKIYNNNYKYYYNTKINCVNAGLIYIYPNHD